MAVKLRVQKKAGFFRPAGRLLYSQTESVLWSYLIRPSYLDGQICVVRQTVLPAFQWGSS